MRFATTMEVGRMTRGKATLVIRDALPNTEYSESLRHMARNCQTMIPVTIIDRKIPVVLIELQNLQKDRVYKDQEQWIE